MEKAKTVRFFLHVVGISLNLGPDFYTTAYGTVPHRGVYVCVNTKHVLFQCKPDKKKDTCVFVLVIIIFFVVTLPPSFKVGITNAMYLGI